MTARAGVIKGKLGAAPQQAGMKFQSQRGLAQTGIVDAQTRSAMNMCGGYTPYSSNSYSASPYSYSSYPYTYNSNNTYSNTYPYNYGIYNQPYSYNYTYNAPTLTSFS